MSVTELKALAFDLVGQRENVNNNLQILQEELRKRALANKGGDDQDTPKVAEETPKEDVKKD